MSTRRYNIQCAASVLLGLALLIVIYFIAR